MDDSLRSSKLRQGAGTRNPLKALYAELNYTPISELAAIRPILYWVRVVRNHRAAVYLETLEEVISSDDPGGCFWGAYVKKTLENLWLKDLWVDPGRITKDTECQIKDRYWELSKTRVYQELRPDSIMHYYFNNVYDPTPQAYLDMLYPELKRTLYMKYRLGVLPLEFCDCTPGEVDNVDHFTLACKKFDVTRRRWLLPLFKDSGANSTKTALLTLRKAGYCERT
ncbi:hypothetical protein NDU88_006524 [Pleurodeles waltl]|uniref:Uncharacterized protein n=1 Tax=Pleurodeles waltl TaxID=8319 RepID=A0AAV7WF33_PLEWA|nr:hypothetical protein NDU88_006524 [Pleurodeles waltl]